MVLGGVGITLAATGCQFERPHTATRSAASDDDDVSPDLLAVGSAVTVLSAAEARLRVVTKRTPAIAASLRLHQVHLDRLRGVAPAAVPLPRHSPAPVVRRLPADSLILRRDEQQLVHQLSGLAQRAQSGELARLFAAMAAATAQRLQAWPVTR